MAQTGYTGVPNTEPVASPAPYQSLTPPHANANQFGAQVGEGLQQLGQGALRAGSFFGEVAADSASNEYAERVTELMTGVPGKMVQGPDGQQVPDTGYMGLKGRAALDARPDLDRQMDQLRTGIRGQMVTPQQQLRFDDFSRRHKAWAEDRIGQHADQQANVWYDQVEKASAGRWQKHIANNATDPAAVLEGREGLRSAYVKQAQRLGGGPELIQAAMDRADREAVAAQASAIAVTDPMRAMRIIENNKAALGTYYDEMANHIRPRARQAEGREWADTKLSGGEADNNIGNITKSNFNYMGGKGAPRGNFETFQTPEHGVAAAYVTMQAKARDNGGSISFSDLIGGNNRVQGWAATPKTDAERNDPMLKGNNAQAYAQQLAESVGLKPGDKVPLGDADKMATVLKKMNTIEKGRQSVPDAAFKNGIVLASGGQLQVSTPQPKTQNQLLNEALDAFPDNPEAQSAAIARINQSYRIRNAGEAKSKAAFEQRENDSVAAAQQTGTPPNPLTERDFVNHYGQENGTAKFTDYQEKVKFGSDWHTLQDMPDADQRTFLADRLSKLDATQPGFARAQQYQTNLEKAVDLIQKNRREDPAQSVARSPAVLEAQSHLDPHDPAGVQNLGRVRMQAQAQFGIEGDAQTPITKAEALKVMNPVIMALPGNKSDALEKVASDLRTAYGNELAVPAFVYALRAMHISGAAAEAAGGVLDSLAGGGPLTSADREAARNASQQKAMQDALDNPPPPTMMQRWTQAADEMRQEANKQQGKTLVPNADALRMLRDNPSTSGEFDKQYGPGKAKEIMEQFPWYFQKRGANGR